MTTPTSAKDKIILPLDVPDATGALRLVERVADTIGFFKVGLELFTRCGPGIIERVRSAAAKEGNTRCGIFLDLKLHDIPNTVAGAVRAAATWNVEMLTVHLAGGGAMLRAAVAEAPEHMLLLGVTVLTSSDAGTLGETGVEGNVETQVNRLAQLAVDSGLRGVVASPLETASLRRAHGDRLKIVTPGVRPRQVNAPLDDQRRVLTPGEAIRAGADYLVIGRPISAAPDPGEAARLIAQEIAANSPALP